MSTPQSYKAFRRSEDGSRLEMGRCPVPVIARFIPASDCAAEAVAVGSEVSDFAPGDRVAPIFDLNNLLETEEKTAHLGGDVDGVLRQLAVFDQKVLVHLPKHLSWEEAACITCAGTTAWTALEMPRSNGTALLQGEYFWYWRREHVCFVNLPGSRHYRPIITSPSDKKLDIARSLGQPGEVDIINYRTHPEWDKRALHLTHGRGVDVVVENVGPTTIAQSLRSLVRRGTVSQVGFLGGFNIDRFPDTVGPLLGKSAVIRGIAVGSKIDQQNLCDFLAERKISLRPLLNDTIFSFEDSQAAFDHLYAARHMGKVVIKV
ncbi:hypothetical protein CNMCM7691_006847 [Aspergillus felis]|uniref:Enoyl reductase (ER) domain-containing protein n=1 Tax=Aspergillus felis TaxID=1287682 RepID=A0A8H6V8V9_9EURO|nr:hypothetical protein CNMCM7691_006847 [Aspergillus felis]